MKGWDEYSGDAGRYTGTSYTILKSNGYQLRSGFAKTQPFRETSRGSEVAHRGVYDGGRNSHLQGARRGQGGGHC